MEFLQLIFSGPGATICVCFTVLIIVFIYLIFNERFKGLSVGYKELKVETPKAPVPSSETSVEVIQDVRNRVEPKESTDVNRSPLIDLYDAAAKQDRAGIEAAIEKMREDLPFGLKAQELEAFKSNELLRAGFTDALHNLKNIEESQVNQIQASLYLAHYYFGTRAFAEAEAHLRIADERAHTDERKVDIALARSDVLELTKGKSEAVGLLESRLIDVVDNNQRFRLFREIGNLSKGLNDDSRATIAYEQALRCSPEHIETRFKLALIYGANPALKMLGVRHYRIILQQNHLHSGALNNLGLLYGELGLPISKIIAIKKAAEQKDGHAIGNLASLYAEFGFSDDAEKLINETPKEIALSDRVIAAQQYLRKAENENGEKKEKLIHEAEELSSLVTDFEFAKQFEPDKYLGAWVEADGKSNIDIEKPGGAYKLTIQADGRRIFGHSCSLSLINHIDFGNVDSSTLSLLMPRGDVTVAILIGETVLRVIEIDGPKIKSRRDYGRPAK